MSTLSSYPKKKGSKEDKENEIAHEAGKKAKNDLAENKEWVCCNGTLEEDQVEVGLLKAKRKMKFQSVENFSFQLNHCEMTNN